MAILSAPVENKTAVMASKFAVSVISLTGELLFGQVEPSNILSVAALRARVKSLHPDKLVHLLDGDIELRDEETLQAGNQTLQLTGVLEDTLQDVEPKRFGLNYQPPSIVLEYAQLSTGKLFHRRFSLRQLQPSSDATRIAKTMRKRNPTLLVDVPEEQLVSLVKRLQLSLNGDHLPTASPKVNEGQARDDLSEPMMAAGESKADGVDYDNEDLNKLLDHELALRKAQMDVNFFKNQKKPGDLDYEYDVPFDVDTENADSCGWDSDDE